MEDMFLLWSEISDSIYQSSVFSRLNTFCTNSCETPWRQNAIMTELQHLFYLRWTLFVWRKGLCSANTPSFLPLIHTIICTSYNFQKHCGESNTRVNELLCTSLSFIQFLIYSICHLVNHHLLAATWLLYRSRPSSHNPKRILHLQSIHPVWCVFVACCEWVA